MQSSGPNQRTAKAKLSPLAKITAQPLLFHHSSFDSSPFTSLRLHNSYEVLDQTALTFQVVEYFDRYKRGIERYMSGSLWRKLADPLIL
jgi:hypothetical protein